MGSMKLMSNADNKREKVKMVIDYFEQRLSELKKEKEELSKFEKLDEEKRSIEYQIYDKEKKETQKLLNKLQENEELHGELKEIRGDIEEYETEKNALISNLEKTMGSLKKKKNHWRKIMKIIKEKRIN